MAAELLFGSGAGVTQVILVLDVPGNVLHSVPMQVNIITFEVRTTHLLVELPDLLIILLLLKLSLHQRTDILL